MGHTRELARIGLLTLGACAVVAALSACGQVRVRPAPQAQTRLTATPAAVAPLSTVTFTLPYTRPVAPSDVLTETSLWLKYLPGVESWDTFYACNDDPYAPPQIELVEDRFGAPIRSIELLQWFSVHVLQPCAMKGQRSLRLTIQYPDGRQEIYDPDEFGGWLTFQARYNDPPGTYTFTASSPSGTAVTTAKITAPVGPRASYVAGERGNDDNSTGLLLYGFSPSERVRVLAYAGEWVKAEFVAQSEFRVDDNGRLRIMLPDDLLLYAVIGEDVGRVPVASGAWLGEVLATNRVLGWRDIQGPSPEDVLPEFKRVDELPTHVSAPCPAQSLQEQAGPDAVATPALQVEWSDVVPLRVCESVAGVPLTWTLITPGGEVMYPFLNVADVVDRRDVYDGHYVKVRDPLGIYVARAESADGGRFGFSFEVTRSTVPRVYKELDTLYLFNFAPRERVRVFAYDVYPEITQVGWRSFDVAWREFQVDDQGELVISSALRGNASLAFVVIGEQTGEVLPRNQIDWFGGQSILKK